MTFKERRRFSEPSKFQRRKVFRGTPGSIPVDRINELLKQVRTEKYSFNNQTPSDNLLTPIAPDAEKLS